MKKFVKTYYVVHVGRIPGIYSNWEECKKQIDKFEGAIFKKFTNKKEAEEFLKNGFGEGKKPKIITRRENEDKRNNEKILNSTNDNSNTIFIYTDGSCIKGGVNNITRAGYGIYIPEKNIEVSAPLLNQKLTNNRAEMTAIINSIKYLDGEDLLKKICIITDSQYSMYIYHGTGERYEKNNYKTEDGKDVPNIDLIKQILELKRTYNIELLKVRAHTGKKDEYSKGNEIADKLATSGAFTEISSSEKTVFNNLCNKHKVNKNNYDSDDIIESDNENNDNVSNNVSNNVFLKKKIKTENDIDKDIQFNELFDFEETQIENDEELTSLFKSSIKNKSMKSIKLSNWFVKR